MPPASPPKPYKSYQELLSILESRGMTIEDSTRAIRKLAQVGYYRLSGFWYPCREICFDEKGQAKKESFGSNWSLKRHDTFLSGTSFNSIFALYLLDKKLRILVFDALERIEIFTRSIIAHELGRVSPLAYIDENLIRPKFKKLNDNGQSTWLKFLAKQQALIEKSREDCIVWHKTKNMEIPFWVVIETWDFGMLNCYYRMLKPEYKTLICSRIDDSICPVFGSWLETLNTLRNKCAHHTRIWNTRFYDKVNIPQIEYFENTCPHEDQRQRIFGCISIIWYLLHIIGPRSKWIYSIETVLNDMPILPNCSLRTMGCTDPHKFPLDLFVSNRPKQPSQIA